MYADLISQRVPPLKRRRTCDGDHEMVFSEGAIMLAFAMHLFQNEKGVRHVQVFPDGMHDKGTFRFRPWLEAHGFAKQGASQGRTDYAGEYRNGDRTLTIKVRSGQGDVVAIGDAGTIIAECKGGCINSRHAGQKSHLQKRLYEAVGHLIEKDQQAERHVAVLPETSLTLRLAKKMGARAKLAGVEIALISAAGVSFVASQSDTQ